MGDYMPSDEYFRRTPKNGAEDEKWLFENKRANTATLLRLSMSSKT